MILDVEYNNILSSSLEVYAKELPNIPTAQRRETEITIPGRDGTIYTTLETMNQLISQYRSISSVMKLNGINGGEL